MEKINGFTYDEWFNQLNDLITQHNVNKKINKDDKSLKQFWLDGERPAIVLRALFPDFYRF